MDAYYFNVILAFFEGLALILSPCIWPILPIVLSGSLVGNRSRPIGVVTGFIVSFALLTGFSTFIVNMLHINEIVLKYSSYVILILLGCIMISNYLSEQFALLTAKISSLQITNANDEETTGFGSGLFFGTLIGFIWTPCAGPILAAVIVQTIVQHTYTSSFFVILAFSIGAGVPMLLIAIFGRALIKRFSFLRDKTTLIRKLLGYIIIANVILLIFNPTLTFSFSNKPVNYTAALINEIDQPYQAPEISGITQWINSQPLTISQLKGKVVLIDFWTYSCINCLRTLPYLKDWYAKYHKEGLEIIGIHSPEFEFEKNPSNVKNAVEKYSIPYPVALDNQFLTWRNYQNNYWPAQYLIDQQGKVVYQHAGEGDDDIIENNIRFLLGLTKLSSEKTNEIVALKQTPETYLGYARVATFASPEKIKNDVEATYSYPTNLGKNLWALQGKWIVKADRIISASAGASIKLQFKASNVYAVMGMTKSPVTVTVLLNKKAIGKAAGEDVKKNRVDVTGNRLYSIVHYNSQTSGELELIANQPGLELYTFTFGS